MAKKSAQAIQRGKRRSAKVGLVYINEFDSGITRHRRGRGFSYRYASGRTVKSEPTLRRIKSLVIPPAWESVWICRNSRGHVQARGRDEAGRRQYLYHERWNAVSSAIKFERLHLVSGLLPKIRRRVRRDLNRDGLQKEKVLATVVRLIDKAQLRVGNEEYAGGSGARGATTLGASHVELDQSRLSLDFPGKSSNRRRVTFSDAKLTAVVDRCGELDGQFLFCWEDEEGIARPIDSTGVNTYLQEITGESITAKDFRTWWGSVIACQFLADAETAETKAARKRQVNGAIAAAAKALGNTRAVCKSSYVHPGLQAAGDSGEFERLVKKLRRRQPPSEVTQAEDLFARLLPHLDF